MMGWAEGLAAPALLLAVWGQAWLAGRALAAFGATAARSAAILSFGVQLFLIAVHLVQLQVDARLGAPSAVDWLGVWLVPAVLSALVVLGWRRVIFSGVDRA